MALAAPRPSRIPRRRSRRKTTRGSDEIEKRLEAVVTERPDIATVIGGSMNYGLFRKGVNQGMKAPRSARSTGTAEPRRNRSSPRSTASLSARA